MTTTHTTNTDGGNPLSSDREQLFDNGASIDPAARAMVA